MFIRTTRGFSTHPAGAIRRGADRRLPLGGAAGDHHDQLGSGLDRGAGGGRLLRQQRVVKASQLVIEDKGGDMPIADGLVEEDSRFVLY
jgi:hypothetical protein